MDRLFLSTSSSASGHGLDPLAPVAARIGFDIEDSALRDALRRRLLARPDITESDIRHAAVIVTDHPVAAGPTPVLTIGTDSRPNPGDSAIQTLDPGLVLAAAALVAGGHRIEPALRAEGEAADRLSQRERQVAALLVEGASNKVIARALGISVHTAKFHVAAVLEKLGARNRADAVAIALREGLVAV